MVYVLCDEKKCPPGSAVEIRSGRIQILKFWSGKMPLQNFQQNSSQEHNLKLTPQKLGITRDIDGVAAFVAFMFLLILGTSAK